MSLPSRFAQRRTIVKPTVPHNNSEVAVTGVIYQYQNGPNANTDTGNGGLEITCPRALKDVILSRRSRPLTSRTRPSSSVRARPS